MLILHGKLKVGTVHFKNQYVHIGFTCQRKMPQAHAINVSMLCAMLLVIYITSQSRPSKFREEHNRYQSFFINLLTRGGAKQSLVKIWTL